VLIRKAEHGAEQFTGNHGRGNESAGQRNSPVGLSPSQKDIKRHRRQKEQAVFKVCEPAVGQKGDIDDKTERHGGTHPGAVISSNTGHKKDQRPETEEDTDRVGLGHRDTHDGHPEISDQ